MPFRTKSETFTDRWLIPVQYFLNLAGFGLIAFLPDIFHMNSQSVTVPFRALVLLVSAVMLVKAATAGGLPKTIGLKLFIAFWCIYLLRMVSDAWISPVVLIRPVETYFLFGFGVSMIPAISFFASSSETSLRRARTALFAALLLILAFTLFYGLPTIFAENSRLTGNSTDNPISTGHLGGSLSLISAALYFERRRLGLLGLVYLLSFILGIAVLLLSGSRGPILSVALAFGFLLIFSLRKISKTRLAAILILIALVAPVLIAKVTASGGSLVDRVTYLQDRSNVETDVRAGLWQEGWSQFLERPLFGMSLDLKGLGYPHNILIEAFMATGIFGGMTLACLMLFGVAQAVRLARRGDPALWIGLLYLQYLIGALLSGTLYDNSQFWCLLAGVAAAGYPRRQGQQ